MLSRKITGYDVKRLTESSDFVVEQLNTVVSVYNLWERGEVMV